MDESIKNAEKLIAAANTALARMKNDISNDDFLYVVDGNKNGEKKKSKPALNLEEDCFSSFLDIPGKILASEELLSFERKNLHRENSINEINSKIEAYKQKLLEKEQGKPLETWNFNRNELDMDKNRECVVSATKTASDTNLSRKWAMKTGVSNVTEDLKSKLLQTQAIVDRGIQTAREINETVNIFKSKPLKTSRFDEISLGKSKSCEKLRKSESKSYIKSVDVKKCRKCNGEITTKYRIQKNEDNVSVTRVQGNDSNPRKHKKLYLQQLPSLNIPGDLTCQKIPSVDILPGKRECLSVRANTAFETYSHEQILSNRIDRALADIKTWNNLTLNIGKKTNMECSNCGMVMTVRNRCIDPEQIDELLRICDYNVFDPRIDEFVESGRVKKEEVKYTQTEEKALLEPEKQIRNQVLVEETPFVEEKLKITDLSKELTRKYREKAAELETDHLEFESILRDVFEKIDESRQLFTNCEYLSQITKGEKRKVSLTKTKPVLVSYTGSAEEIDDYNKMALRPKKSQKYKMSSQEIKKKLEKKELRTNCKELSSVTPVKDNRKQKSDVETSKFASYESKEACPDGETRKDLTIQREVSPDNKNICNDLDLIVVEEPATSLLEQKQALKSDIVSVKLAEESGKHAETGSEYESDFEEESFDEVPVAVEKNTNNRSNLWANRLSTITEVESDVHPNDSAKDKNGVHLTPEAPTVPGDENSSDAKPARNKTIPESGNVSDDDTEKLLKQVNKDLEEVASLPGKRMSTVKDVPDNVTEPLKQVLDALKNQFERTELLADKLSESIREVQKPEDPSEICRRGEIIYNLKKTKKNIEKPKPPIKTDLLDSLRTATSEEDLLSGKSSGELVISNGRQHNLSANDVSLAGSIHTFADKSYSEGEISELEVLVSGRSSPSVGEVINENYSDRSERNSVLRFP